MNPNLTSSFTGRSTRPPLARRSAFGFFPFVLLALLLTSLSLVYVKARRDLEAAQKQEQDAARRPSPRSVGQHLNMTDGLEEPPRPSSASDVAGLSPETGKESKEILSAETDQDSLQLQEEKTDSTGEPGETKSEAVLPAGTSSVPPIAFYLAPKRPWYFGAVRFTNVTMLIEDLPSATSQAYQFVSNFAVSMVRELLHSSKGFYFHRLALFDSGFPEKSICSLSPAVTFAYAIQESFAPRIIRLKFHTVT